MGAAKEMWMDEIERTADRYVMLDIDEDEFRSEMERLGFDAGEISDHLEALAQDRANQPEEAAKP